MFGTSEGNASGRGRQACATAITASRHSRLSPPVPSGKIRSRALFTQALPHGLNPPSHWHIRIQKKTSSIFRRAPVHTISPPLYSTFSLQKKLHSNQPLPSSLPPQSPALLYSGVFFCLLLGGGGTGNNLTQLVGNNGLSGAVEKNLELANHLTGVLGGVVHGVAAGRDLARVTLSKTLRSLLVVRIGGGEVGDRAYAEDGVGEGKLAEVGELLLLNLEGGDVVFTELAWTITSSPGGNSGRWGIRGSEGRQRKVSTWFCALGGNGLHPRYFHHPKGEGKHEG